MSNEFNLQYNWKYKTASGAMSETISEPSINYSQATPSYSAGQITCLSGAAYSQLPMANVTTGRFLYAKNIDTGSGQISFGILQSGLPTNFATLNPLDVCHVPLASGAVSGSIRYQAVSGTPIALFRLYGA